MTDRPPDAEIAALMERERDDLADALGILRERIEHEFRLTERLEGKARQEFALATGFFALAQAGAFASFGADSITTTEKALVLGTALAAAISLVVMAILLRAVERVRDQRELEPKAIFEWCRDQTRPKSVTAHLIWALCELAGWRSAGNEARVKQVKAVAAATGATLILTGAELALALVARM